jgi:hypothetical protein
MALPKISQPLFELTIPSTNKKIHYRPFTVKEEKILLIAQESKDIDQIITAIKQLATNCLQDVSESEIDNLAMFDLEYILINLRAKSVGEEIQFAIKDPDSEETIELSLDLNDIEIKRDEKHSKIIKINDEISISMKYPRIDQLRNLSTNSEDDTVSETLLFDTMIDCIDTIIEGEQVYKTSDFTKEEIVTFVDGFSSNNIKGVRTFFETMPRLRYETKYKLKDGTEKTFIAEGTETFFI